MQEKIERQKEILDTQKKRLDIQQKRWKAQKKRLSEREKKLRRNRLIRLGGLTVKAGVDNLNNNTLLGALMDVKERSKNEELFKKWTDVGAETFESDKEKNGEPLFVSFESEPERETKDKLKNFKLFWNKWLRKWQGYARFNELEKALEGSGAKIEKANVLEERKLRAHRLIGLGGLTVKAGVDNLNNNTLLGALMDVKERSKNEELLKKWTDVGAETFESDKEKNGEPLFVSFESEPTRETKDTLKKFKMLWKKELREWKGYARFNELEKALEGTGAKIEKASAL